VRLFYCDHYEIPLPDGHKFPIEKYRLLRERIAADGFWKLEPAEAAPVETIKLAHDPVYVDQFVNGTLAANAMRRIGFPWSEGLVARTLASAGGTLAATRDAIATGFGGTLAGGTHHAFRAEGSGFCVFNDVVISIHAHRFKRAAVVDLDVHQGDGTAHFFEDDPNVLTISMHGANNFPFRKQRSKIDVELADKTRDEEYLRVLDSVLPRVMEFEPEMVFYLSGVDALASDVLGRLALTPEGLEARDRRVIGDCHRHGLPLVITLGGGYSKQIELTAEAHATTFRVAAEIYESRGSR
jgi:acetoin utilization deacetylase AcuC-like enzyme